MKTYKIYFGRLLALIFFISTTASAQDDWTWEQVSPLTTARMGHCGVSFGDHIYVFGGMTFHRQAMLTNSVEVYNPVTDEWTAGPNLPVPLYQATAVVNGRLIYIIGGTTLGGDPNVEITVFDPNNRQHPYSKLGRLPHPRWAMATVSVGRRILILGGVSGRQEYRRDGYWWNPVDSAANWTAAPQLNQPSAGFGLAYNGNLWAVGGISFGPLNRVEVIRNGVWEILPRQCNLPEPRGELGTVFLGDTLMVAAGGFGRGSASSDVFAFSTDSMRWSRLPSMNEARAEFTLLTLRDQVYAIGGGTSTPNQMGFIHNSVEVLKKSNSINTGTEPVLPATFKTTIWPNPANGVVSIILPPKAQGLQLLDINGRVVGVSNPSVSGNVWSEDVTKYPAGQYIVLYFDAGGLGRSAGGLVILK